MYEHICTAYEFGELTTLRGWRTAVEVEDIPDERGVEWKWCPAHKLFVYYLPG